MIAPTTFPLLQSKVGQVPKKPNVAIVDDDQSAREGMVELVTAMGFKAVPFDSATDFLRSRCAGHADCLITDVRMRKMNGLELLDHLRRSGKSIPAIVITAFRREPDRRRALNGGAICYLSKPFDDNELLECIRTAFSSGSQRADS
jgi:FixJ family two-component response regulator